MKPTQIERDAMEHLSQLVLKSMRSKPTLRVLSRLQDKGWIDFDPMAGEAALTEDGRVALNQQ